MPPAFAALAVLRVVSFTSGSAISKSDTGIIIGKVPPDAWIVVDTQILGTSIRASSQGSEVRGKLLSLGPVEKVDDTLDNYEEFSAREGETARNMPAASVKKLELTKNLKLINLSFFLELGTLDKKKIAVVISELPNPRPPPVDCPGEFHSPRRSREYLPDWLGKIFVKSQ